MILAQLTNDQLEYNKEVIVLFRGEKMRLPVKIFGVSTAVLALCCGIAAAQSTEDSAAISIAVQKEVLRQEMSDPLVQCVEALKKVSNPKKDTDKLMDALRLLLPYEKLFSEAESPEEIRALAKNLMVPWNTYRGNSLIEIFDEYVPDYHGEPVLTLLEFYVKLYTMPAKTVRLAHQNERDLPVKFMDAERTLRRELHVMSPKDSKRIVEVLASFAQQYNELYKQDKDKASSLSENLFKMPIPTAWERITSIIQLRRKYLLFVDGGGDFVRSYTIEELVEKYGITTKQAEQIAKFNAHFYH